jgi:hypothetical protein
MIIKAELHTAVLAISQLRLQFSLTVIALSTCFQFPNTTGGLKFPAELPSVI